MKIKCAIFDFDGTLFDSMYIWDTVGETYLRSLGKEPASSMGEDVKTMSLHQSARYFQNEYGLDLSVEEIIGGVNQIIEHYYIYEVQPKAGAAAFLKKLQQTGAAMCIATAIDRYLIEAALKRCGMTGFFEEIFTCSEVGHGKDEPVIYRRAMECFNAERGNTVVFEDAFHAVKTAKADGFMTAAVFDKTEQRQDELRQLCDCYLEDFQHLDIFLKFASA